jgi:5-formyltetrahydrofolate cyclo-ligase
MQMAGKPELRIWAKAQRAALPDVSNLVCGHLVRWLLETQVSIGLDHIRDSKAGDHKGRPYGGMGSNDELSSQAGEPTVRPYDTMLDKIRQDKNVYDETLSGIRRGGSCTRPTNQPVVLSYKAFGTEISLEMLPEYLPHCQFLTTRVAPNHALTLHQFSSATQKNRYGILEPPPDAPIIAPELVDVVLIPGLAFTLGGKRLGYGGGFYDRLLPQLRPDCLLVGITQRGLLLPNIPLEPHDMQMQFLALETGVVAVQ